jgi:hypothetical protein
MDYWRGDKALELLRKMVGVQHVFTVWLSGLVYDTGKARHVQQYTCHNHHNPTRQVHALLACTACTNYSASQAITRMHATTHVMPAHAYELMIKTTSQQEYVTV